MESRGDGKLCAVCEQVMDENKPVPQYGSLPWRKRGENSVVWDLLAPNSTCPLCDLVLRIVSDRLSTDDNYKGRKEQNLCIFLDKWPSPHEEQCEAALHLRIHMRDKKQNSEEIWMQDEFIEVYLLSDLANFRPVSQQVDYEYFNRLVSECDECHISCQDI